MAGSEMLMVFCYDVTEARQRRRVAAILEERMVRVQQSVFEARMSEAEADRLARRASLEIAPTDSLRIYALSAHGRRRSRVYGAPPLHEESDFYLL